MRRASWLVASGIALALVACGGEAGTADGGEGLGGYFQALEAIAQDASAASARLGDDMQQAISGAGSEEEASAAVRAVLEDGVDVFGTALSRVEDLSPPEAAADAHTAFVDATREGNAKIAAAVDRFDELGLEGVMAELGGEEFQAIERAQDEACFDLQDIADENGIDVDLACGDDGASPTAAAGPPDSPSGEVERYRNEDFDFTLDYPTSWAPNEEPSGGLLAQFFPLNAGGTSMPNLGVVVEELRLDLTPSQYMDVGWQALLPQLRDVEKLGTSELTIGGLPAASTEFRAHLKGQDAGLHFLQIAVLDRRTAFVFTFAAGDDAFDSYRPDAEEIVGSFRRA